MIRKNDIVNIQIEDLTVVGAGIGRIDGFAVFVPKALPGETADVKIIKKTKNYAVGKLIDIKQASAHRVAPFCGVFARCGGCTLQHLDYEQQLAFKQRHIQACFARIGGIDIALPDVLPSENTRDYRNKASFPVADNGGRAEAGFYAPRSHTVVPADCHVQHPSINAVKNAVLAWANENGITAYDEKTRSGVLRHIIGRRTSDGAVMAGAVLKRNVDTSSLAAALHGIDGLCSIVVNINDKDTNAIFGKESRVIYGDAFLTEKYGDLSFRAGLTSFLQVNHAQSVRLYDTALGYADLAPHDIIYDLYCGIGTMTLMAAQRAKSAVGIEFVQSAVDNAIENARINGIDNVAFFAGDAAKMMDKAIYKCGRPDVVIIDPPRKGCDKALIASLIATAPSRIVYVSCNPATLARDVALLCEGGYKLRRVTGVDMFPHTTHVESCCLLVKE